MITQTKGKIFLADERGHNEVSWYRSYNTFNFGRYQNEYKTPAGNLYVLNDDTLAPGGSIRMGVEEDTGIVLLPMVGAIEYVDNLGNKGALQAGEAQLLNIPKGGFIRITNPFEHELVGFLQLWTKMPTNGKANQHASFDLDKNKNQLIGLFDAIDLSIGQFDGRAEAEYKPNNPGAALFMFVIDGEFEAQHRLLHARDGLALWDVAAVEMEALSNEAIILVVEAG